MAAEITAATAAQMNVYEVSVTRADGSSVHGATLHFDLYNHVSSPTSAVLAPQPLDVNVAPTPTASVGLLGIALLGMAGWCWRRRRPV